jgi:S1-C subfamily serine protease
LIPSLLTGTAAPAQGGYMGVYIQTVTPALVSSHHLTVTAGAYVQAIVPGLPAASAGIHANDVIVSVHGKTIATDKDVATVMRSLSPGQTVTVKVVRGSETLSISVTLIARPH